VRLIFLAASILAQPIQRPLSENDPIEKMGPPHFLHLAGTVITTYFMINSGVASYKQETKHLILANQSRQRGVIFNGSQKTRQPPPAEELLADPMRFMITEN
jgi:hypothetical protein